MKNISMTFETAYDDSIKLWFSASACNALCEFSKTEKKLHYINEFPDENMEGKFLYKQIVKNRNELVFAPGSAKEIAAFNIKTKTFKKYALDVPIKTRNILYNENNKFFSAVSWKQYVFMLGTTYPAIIRLNVDTGKIDYFYDAHNELDKIAKKETIFFHKNVAVKGDIIYAPVCNSNSMLIFNMEKCDYRIVRIGHKNDSYIGICYYKNYIWMVNWYGDRIVKWNISDESVEMYQLPLKDKGKKSAFMNLLAWNNKLYLPAYGADKSFIFDINKENIKLIEFEEGEKSAGDDMIHFPVAYIKDQTLILFSAQSSSLIFYDVNDQTSQKIDIQMPEEINDKLEVWKIIRRIESGNIFTEGKVVNADWFCGFISKNFSRNSEYNEKEYCTGYGKNIYREMREYD